VLRPPFESWEVGMVWLESARRVMNATAGAHVT